ncbi:hypothetical protein VTK56DRAFT_2925 [Thermocarpiscus australiensis]
MANFSSPTESITCPPTGFSQPALQYSVSAYRLHPLWLDRTASLSPGLHHFPLVSASLISPCRSDMSRTTHFVSPIVLQWRYMGGARDSSLQQWQGQSLSRASSNQIPSWLAPHNVCRSRVFTTQYTHCCHSYTKARSSPRMEPTTLSSREGREELFTASSSYLGSEKVIWRSHDRSPPCEQD